MKISKIPGLGRFGIFVDDVDFDTITDEEWTEIGKLHLDNFVTIIRNTNLTTQKYERLINDKFGPQRVNAGIRYYKKYGKSPFHLVQDLKNGLLQDMDPEDKKFLFAADNINYRDETGRHTTIHTVSGKKDEHGNALGMFAEGELLWHSNESGDLCFTPGVSLLASSGVVGSSTGFLTTVDYYESVSESFRSELDEIVLVHRFSEGKINPGLNKDQDLIMYKNMCPEESRLPLVITSPGGYKGLHFSVNTIAKVEGMTDAESDKFLDAISKELFVDKYIYDHWYQNDNDLCLFDNSITLHRRLGGITNRVCYRIQHDYNYIQKEPYIPYLQEEFRQEYVARMKSMTNYFN
jgi:alpha-ketoglutarate-dependent taurine dioxygenase